VRGGPRAAVALAAALATAWACGGGAPAARAPAPAGSALIGDAARRALTLRVLTAPGDLAARRALAALAEATGRPAEAIEQLEAVARIGGPLGPRWGASDRARLARLLAARGRARLARGAPTAIADLDRARALGEPVPDAERALARQARALARLRHADAAEREAGHRELRALAGTAGEAPGLGAGVRGLSGSAQAAARGAYGAWLWARGARRAAWDELAAWRAAAPAAGPATGAPPPSPIAPAAALHATYLEARAWWSPPDGPPPPAAELIGPARCWFRGAPGCEPVALLAAPADAAAAAAAPRALATEPAEIEAWLAIALIGALRGEQSWGAAFAARVDPAAARAHAEAARRGARGAALDPAAAIAVAILLGPDAEAARAEAHALIAPRFTQALAALAALAAAQAALQPPARRPRARAAAARGAPGTPGLGEVRAWARAGSLALRRAPPDRVAAALGAAGATPEGRALLGIAEAAWTARATRGLDAWALATDPRLPLGPITAAAIHVDAILAYVAARVPWAPAPHALRPVAEGYLRDPAIADRRALDAIAAAADAAVAHAALGALFEAVGDPARARAAWQAAVDASAEPAAIGALAEAAARAGDPDAALVHATTAAAAAGDPAPVWIGVARELDAAGAHVHALEAARSAIDLAGRAAIGEALAIAARASRALGRVAQATALASYAAAVTAPLIGPGAATDPTDADGALATYRALPAPGAVEQLWIASRWSPRAVAARAALRVALPADDPRQLALIEELLALAADPDPARGRAATAALRPSASAPIGALRPATP
jgi:hypothetical protein